MIWCGDTEKFQCRLSSNRIEVPATKQTVTGSKNDIGSEEEEVIPRRTAREARIIITKPNEKDKYENLKTELICSLSTFQENKKHQRCNTKNWENGSQANFSEFRGSFKNVTHQFAMKKLK